MKPDQFRGSVIIEWTVPQPQPGDPARYRILDAETGRRIDVGSHNGLPFLAVKVGPEPFITAELNMFVDEAGDPIYELMEPIPGGRPGESRCTNREVIRDGDYVTEVFPFLVAEMRVKQ